MRRPRGRRVAKLAVVVDEERRTARKETAKSLENGNWITTRSEQFIQEAAAMNAVDVVPIERKCSPDVSGIRMMNLDARCQAASADDTPCHAAHGFARIHAEPPELRIGLRQLDEQRRRPTSEIDNAAQAGVANRVQRGSQPIRRTLRECGRHRLLIQWTPAQCSNTGTISTDEFLELKHEIGVSAVAERVPVAIVALDCIGGDREELQYHPEVFGSDSGLSRQSGRGSWPQRLFENTRSPQMQQEFGRIMPLNDLEERLPANCRLTRRSRRHRLRANLSPRAR